MYTKCPVCGSDNITVSDDFAFCHTCRWGEKDYNISDLLKATEKSMSYAIEDVSAYLMANDCIVSLKNLCIRFNNRIKFDTVLNGMEKRGLIQIIKTADGEKHVVLLPVPTKKCDWITVRVWSSEDDECDVPAYRIPCTLSRSQFDELRKDIETYANEWVDCESS